MRTSAHLRLNHDHVCPRRLVLLLEFDENAGLVPGLGANGRPFFVKYGANTSRNFFIPMATNRYDAMQSNLTKRFSQGLFLTMSYTWSKAIGINAGNSDSGLRFYVPSQYSKNRSVADFDRTHSFVTAANYELPFGKGRRWANSGPGSWIVGGWKLTGSTSFQTGFPITPSTSYDVANVGTGSWRPDRTCNGSLPPSQRTVERWFNASCFTDQFLLADLAAGHPRFGNSGRSILDGPGFQNWDFAFLKEFPFGERLRMQFRAEFFNAFNQAHFSDPVRDVTDSTVGQIFGAAEPRDIQLAVKFIW